VGGKAAKSQKPEPKTQMRAAGFECAGVQEVAQVRIVI